MPSWCARSSAAATGACRSRGSPTKTLRATHKLGLLQCSRFTSWRCTSEGSEMDALLAHLLDAAGRAPSAHNTQPWRLRWKGDALEVRTPEERKLPAVDPAGSD